MGLGQIIKKIRNLRGMTQKNLGDKIGLDDVRIRQYELNIRNPKEDTLEDISSALKINKEYLKEVDYPYDENDLMRFLFRLDDSIEVNIENIATEDDNDIILGVYFGGKDMHKINNMLHKWKDMKLKYQYKEISKEVLEDWKANFPKSTQKDYITTEMNKKRIFKDEIRVKTNIDLLDDIFGKKE